MKFTSIFVVASAVVLVAAAPTFQDGAISPETSPAPQPGAIFRATEEDDDDDDDEQGTKQCPASFRMKGKCNGTKCKWFGINWKCDKGTCVGKEGGDGACCGWKKPYLFSPISCPNGGWSFDGTPITP